MTTHQEKKGVKVGNQRIKDRRSDVRRDQRRRGRGGVRNE